MFSLGTHKVSEREKVLEVSQARVSHFMRRSFLKLWDDKVQSAVDEEHFKNDMAVNLQLL